MFLPSLIHQRQHKRSKPRDHIKCLERRLAPPLGFVNCLVKESPSMQRHLSCSHHGPQVADCTSHFTDLICKGKVKDALHCLSGEGHGGVHSLPDITMEGLDECKSVLDVLKDKHPAGRSPLVDTLLPSTASDDSPTRPTCIFHALDNKAIRQAALRT